MEYLQEALNTNGDVKVTVDGNFDGATLKAVLAFQKAHNLLVDGTVGNQTWAALRQGTPEAPSTDGRKPHTFEQAGKQARFFTEKDPVTWVPEGDILFINIVSVGDTPADGKKATMRVTPPGGKPRVTQLTLPKGAPIGATDQGAMHMIEVPKFTATFPSTPAGAPGTDYQIDAYLEPELGGDRFTGKPTL